MHYTTWVPSWWESGTAGRRCRSSLGAAAMRSQQWTVVQSFSPSLWMRRLHTAETAGLEIPLETCNSSHVLSIIIIIYHCLLYQRWATYGLWVAHSMRGLFMQSVCKLSHMASLTCSTPGILATSRPDGSILYRTRVMGDQSLHCGNRDFQRFRFLWPWPWPDDLHIQTWPIFPGAIPYVQIWTSHVKAFESHCLTDRQTETKSTEIIKHSASHVLKTKSVNKTSPKM